MELNIKSFHRRLKKMLVLNRKQGESIIIGENIEVKILGIKDGKIKIGIEAPKDVRLLRKEVYEEVIESNKKSIEIRDNILDIIRENKG